MKLKDNGGGILLEYREKIYEHNGTIKFDIDEGVIWDITIPMTRSDKLD